MTCLKEFFDFGLETSRSFCFDIERPDHNLFTTLGKRKYFDALQDKRNC